MAVAYYDQLWAGLYSALVNNFLNLLYCVYLTVSKQTFLKLFLMYPAQLGAVVPGLNNPLAIIHPIALLTAYLILAPKLAAKLKSIILIWVALFLGGWWAFQEFNWGGWWNWDLLESPALLYSFALLTLLHRYVSGNFAHANKKAISAIILVIILVNVRYLVSTSAHSFIGGNLLERYALLFLNSALASFLIAVSFLKLHSLQFLRFFLVYFFISFLFIKLSKATKSRRMHSLMLLVTAVQIFKGFFGIIILKKATRFSFSYRIWSSENCFIVYSTPILNIAWHKEISLGF